MPLLEGPVAIILAAGKSTRMKSELPKVLHPVCGQTMIDHVLNAVRGAGVKSMVVIIGHKADEVRGALEHHGDLAFALQEQQLGTGHAVMMAKQALEGYEGPVLVLAGDTPLLRPQALKRLLDLQEVRKAACIVGTAITSANEGLGRIVRDEQGDFVKIIEHKDASEEQKRIEEINTGCFAFDAVKLFDALTKIRTNNIQSEYYLTDCAGILKDAGEVVLAAPEFDIQQAMGVNTQEQLKEVEAVMQAAGHSSS